MLLENAQTAVAGEWSCKATSVLGSAIKTFEVDVLVPPHIVTQRRQAAKTVIEGASVTLECKVEGTPKPNIIWKFNEKIMDPFFNTFSDDGMRLTMNKVDYLNSGEYKCETENRAGSDQIVHNLRHGCTDF